MKKMIKVMSLSIALMLMLAAVAMPVMATGSLTIPKPNYGAQGTQGIQNAGSNIAGIAATVGIAVALVILIWLAIKYITAAPSDKADIKKSATAYVIGAVLLFAASGVLGLIQAFGTQLGNDIGGNGGGEVDAVSGAGQVIVVEKA